MVALFSYRRNFVMNGYVFYDRRTGEDVKQKRPF